MTITLKVSDNTKQEMIDFFKDYKREKTPAYAIFQADDADTVVTLYESGKAVFQGISADISANIWIERERHLNPLKKIETTNSEKKEKKEKEIEKIDPKIYYSNSIGSDEVGTGDYFGPIVVTSAYVKKEDIPFLEGLGVNSLVFSNKEYNQKYSSDINMNKIKAILHNKVLYNLTNEEKNVDYVVVDQFAKPYVYYNYLKNTPNVVRNITFMTKAEDKCLSVACASIISRYIFIKEFSKLSKYVDIFLPKGASTNVDDVGVKIVNKYGFEKLSEIAKLSFKNTEKIKK